MFKKLPGLFAGGAAGMTEKLHKNPPRLINDKASEFRRDELRIDTLRKELALTMREPLEMGLQP